MKEADLAHQFLSSAEKDLKAIKAMTDPTVFADEVFNFPDEAGGNPAVNVPK